VHRQDYAEHEHLHAHSPGTYTTAGSSRDDGTSEAATAHRRRGGSTGYNASLASGTEGKRPEGCCIAASGGDWTRAQGVKLSPVTAVGEDRAAAGGGSELLSVVLRKKTGESGGRVLQPR
jgi:hypothetical protein